MSFSVGSLVTPVVMCSRELSRIARGLVKDVDLPLSCPLHPERDGLLYHERQKKVIRSNAWRCRLCGKTFVSEMYLDQHLDRKHGDDRGNVTDPECLGDHCLALDCAGAPHLARTAVIAKKRRRRKRSARYAAACDPKTFPAKIQDCKRLFMACDLDVGLCDSLRCSDGRAFREVTSAPVDKPNRDLRHDTRLHVVIYVLFLIGYYTYLYKRRRRQQRPPRRREDRRRPRSSEDLRRRGM